MRLRHMDGSTIHLAYGTNAHPAEDEEGVIDQLSRFAEPVRRRLGCATLGVGLWLAAPVAGRLAADRRALDRLRSRLTACSLEVVTLNGFPYRGFHDPIVKHAVYRPDWSEPSRERFTLDLAAVLAALLPDDVGEGSVSTLPLGWRSPWEECRASAAQAALARVAEGLERLEQRTGRRVRLGLEPEPGCRLESIEETAAYVGGIGSPWIGVCLDACHLAVAFEEPATAIDILAGASVAVVKGQVSSALQVPAPRSAAGAALVSSFCEPRFLHQVGEWDEEGGCLRRADDLPQAIGGALSGRSPWRVHFHLPVHTEESTTSTQLRAFLAAVVGGPTPVTRHLEVETYTWTVLPPDRRPSDEAGLVAGLTEELNWVRARLREAGLEER